MKRKLSVACAAAGAAAIFGASASAQAANCPSGAGVIVVAGSTAVQPVLQNIAPTLAALTPPISLVYSSGLGSCAGLNDMLSSPALPLTGTASAIGADGTLSSCTIDTSTSPGLTIDLAVADVFPKTCSDSAQAPALPASGFNDFWGPIQVMTMVVPSASQRTSISADAAYTVFGFFGQQQYQVLTWTDPLQMFIRKPNSGTINMIGTAIGLPASKWLISTGADGGDAFASQRMSGSGAVLSALQNAAAAHADQAIGILAADFADKYRNPTVTDAGTLSAIKILAYKHTGQSCGYLPDSDSTHYDKINVRQGRYAIWGQVHMVAPVDGSGSPTKPEVKTLLQYFASVGPSPDATFTDVQKEAMIKAEANAFTVPWCAMQVQRDTEIGTPKPFSPAEPCGCFYENLKGSMVSSCTACTMDSQCSGATPKCRHNFCEAK